MTQPADPSRRPGTRRTVLALLIVAIIGTLWVPLYARNAPRLGPFPFFYWYQFIWVLVSSGLCWAGYLLLRTRPVGGQPDSQPNGGRR